MKRNVLTRRRDAAEACRKRFHEKPYQPGVRDCPILAAHALRQQGVKVPYLKGLRWKSEAEGLRALKALGFADLLEAMDGLGLPRIAPAMALIGDVVALPTSHQLGALGVYMGNGNVLAFTDHSPNAEIIVRPQMLCAWRVIGTPNLGEG